MFFDWGVAYCKSPHTVPLICGHKYSLVDSVQHEASRRNSKSISPGYLSTHCIGPGNPPLGSIPLRGFRKRTTGKYRHFQPGYLEAGPALRSVLSTPSTYIWAVASDSQGDAYVATGSPATVLKVTPAGVSTKLFSTKELTVQTVRLGPDGSVYPATVPGGKVYRIKPGQSGLEESTATVVFDAATTAHNAATTKTPDQARYIWDLAFDAQGALYVATGGPAAIYRVDVSTDTPRAEVFFEMTSSIFAASSSSPTGISSRAAMAGDWSIASARIAKAW